MLTPARARSDSAHTRSDSAHTRPDSAQTRPDSAHTRPDSAHTRPDSAHTRPDSAHTRPDSAQTRPDSAPSRPHGASSLPDATFRGGKAEASVQRQPAVADGAEEGPPVERPTVPGQHDRVAAAKTRLAEELFQARQQDVDANVGVVRSRFRGGTQRKTEESADAPKNHSPTRGFYAPQPVGHVDIQQGSKVDSSSRLAKSGLRLGGRSRTLVNARRISRTLDRAMFGDACSRP